MQPSRPPNQRSEDISNGIRAWQVLFCPEIGCLLKVNGAWNKPTRQCSQIKCPAQYRVNVNVAKGTMAPLTSAGKSVNSVTTPRGTVT